MTVEAATEQLAKAIAYWQTMIASHDVTGSDGSHRAAVKIISDLTSGDPKLRRVALESAQGFTIGCGDPIVPRPIPDQWFSTPLGALIGRAHDVPPNPRLAD